MSAGIEAWVGDRAFTPHPTIGEVATSPTMMDDQLALPALRLILGDYSGVTDFKKTNTLEKACRRATLHDKIYGEATKLFDVIIATRLEQTPAGAALLRSIENIQTINDQYKGRMLGSIIRDMAGREGGFTTSLTQGRDWGGLAEEQRQRHIPFPLEQDQCADKRGAASITLLTLLPPITHSQAFVPAIKAMTGVDISTPDAPPAAAGGGTGVAQTLTLARTLIGRLGCGPAVTWCCCAS